MDLTVNRIQAVNVVFKIFFDPLARICFLCDIADEKVLAALIPRRSKEVVLIIEWGIDPAMKESFSN